MSRLFLLVPVLAITFVIGSAGHHLATGQMIYQDVTNNQLGSSYYESNSVGGFLRGNNWFFNFGGPNAANPNFGGQGPLLPAFGGNALASGGGISGGFGFGGGGVSGGLNFNFAQGSTRSATSTSAGVTTMNGFPGSIQSGTIRPFVTGFTPIVSDFPRQSSAEAVQNQRQLADLRQSQQDLQNRRLQTYLQRIRQAESSGNVRMGRANYRSAIANSNGPLQAQLKQNMRIFMAGARAKANELKRGVAEKRRDAE